MALPLSTTEPFVVGGRPQLRLVVIEGGRTPASVYRRRRVLAALLVVLTVVVLAAGWRGAAAVLGGDPASAPGARSLAAEPPALPGEFGGQRLLAGGQYVVQPGDTLWAIARALQPEGDLDRLVDELVDLNGGPELQVGDRVRLPG